MLGARCSVLGEGMRSLPHGVLGRQEEAAAEAEGLAALQEDEELALTLQAGHRRARAPLPRVPLPLTRGCSLVEVVMK